MPHNKGYRLAWRQNMPSSNHSTLSHVHGRTLHSERGVLDVVAAADWGRISNGSPSLVQWVEWFERTDEGLCSGSWMEEQTRKLR